MYKISLYDQNLGSACSGVYEMFVENLEDFEKYWKFVSEEQKQSYLKSKAGEIVTDYYTDDPELNIVQYDSNAKIVGIKEFEKENTFFELSNFFGCPSKYFAQKIKITLYHIRFDKHYYLLGGYQILGVCTKAFLFSGYEPVTVWGNPVLKQEVNPKITEFNKKVDKKRQQLDKEWDLMEEQGGEPDYDYKESLRYFNSENYMDFSGCNLETFCLILLKRYDKNEDFSLRNITEISDEMLEQLLFDIPGEGG